MASPDPTSSSPSKVIKLGKVGYHTHLLDLHRSNSFGGSAPASVDEVHIPDAWYVISRSTTHPLITDISTGLKRLSNDAKNESSLLYTRKRDIHSVGVVFLQMLLGLDVMQQYSDAHDALQNCMLPPFCLPPPYVYLSPVLIIAFLP